MDATTRQLERRLKADPTDGAVALQLARALAREGLDAEARATLRSRFARGELDGDTLALATELGGGSIEGRLRSLPRANWTYVTSRSSPDGLVEITPPVIAFAGVPGAGAVESVLALMDILEPRVVEKDLTRVDDERVIQLHVALARPWVLARGHTIRGIRIVTIPIAPHARKLRKQLLTQASALAFVVDARSEIKEDGSDHTSNEAAWKTLKTDFRDKKPFALDELPILFQYHDPVEEAWHRWLTVAVGLRNVPRVTTGIETSAAAPEPGVPRFARGDDQDKVTVHDGAIETLALLLLGVADAARGVATFRSRFARKNPAG